MGFLVVVEPHGPCSALHARVDTPPSMQPLQATPASHASDATARPGMGQAGQGQHPQAGGAG
jgi:hypothetical protein